jgi:hypothetical protein
MAVRLIRALVGSIFISACLACTVGGPQSDTDTRASVQPSTGTYLGRSPPGMERTLFAPGVVSTGWHELSITFSPAADELFFFASSRPTPDLLPAGPLMYEEISRWLHDPGNGLQDIYWVSAEAIQLP